MTELPYKICDECNGIPGNHDCGICNGVGGIQMTQTEWEVFQKKVHTVNVVFGVIFMVLLLIVIVTQ